jgi:biofilm PGA synthesis N-glycosyltransferase PgaC
MEAVVCAGFLITAVIQFIFWFGIAGRLTYFHPIRTTPRVAPGSTPFISVVICARNELANLQRHLPLVLSQSYPHFEVIVVNDHSTDGSAAYLRHLAKSQSRLRPISLDDPRVPFQGKKPALTAGIHAARGELVLLTDADCRPATPHWIQLMTASLSKTTDLVLGYSPYAARPGLLNLFIRHEAMYTLIQYAGLALSGLPYMGVGRNLLYRKSVWQSVNGFSAHSHVTGGDDDLFVSAVASPSRTALCLHPDSRVISEPEGTLRRYLIQKQRHVSTSVHYPFKIKVALGLLAASHFFFYPLAAYLLSSPQTLPTHVLMLIIAIRLTAVTIQHRRLATLLASPPHQWRTTPLFDLLLPAYFILTLPGLLLSRRTHWSPRTPVGRL